MRMPRDLSDFEFQVLEGRELSSRQRGELFSLFEANYRKANRPFLERSLVRIRHVALAYRDALPVGFALGETRVMDLPRLPRQTVVLAGISCIAPEFRRLGLFSQLTMLAAAAGSVPAAARRLLCGRVAHPAARRTLSGLPGAIPQPGRPPSPWQQEVGTAIAEAYGVHGFDPRTFVCIGDGRPIGYPLIELELEPQEWELFEPVDRDRGDSLLAMGWAPDSPAGWTGSATPDPER
jgi:hypothetical protein